MLDKSEYGWCLELTDSIYGWLTTLQEPGRPGQVLFCREGSVMEPSAASGLGASCLALKLACQIGAFDRFDKAVREGWVEHVRSFQKKKTGYFEDPALLRVVDKKVKRFLFFGRDVMVRLAETRQAAAALMAAGGCPRFPVSGVPDSPEALRSFIEGLPWDTDPWRAGSHASLMGFVLKMDADFFGRRDRFDEAKPVLFGCLDGLRDPVTGSWFKGDVPVNQKVNAAMKVLTLYSMMDIPFAMPEKVVDLCLDSFDDRDACHSLDVLYALHECAKWTQHRRDETDAFAARMLRSIRLHVKPDGALSFFRDTANTTYYGVTVSRGLAESDVHGSHLLAWGITLCAGLLGFSDELGWRLPVT